MSEETPPTEALSEPEKTRIQAQTLYVCGYSPLVIAKRLGLKVAQIDSWIRLGRWDQSREKARRAVDKKILATVKSNAARLVSEQLGQLRWIQAKLFNNLRGLDRNGRPILDADGNPLGELNVLNAFDAVQHLISANRLTKDWLMQVLPSISEALPNIDPADLQLVARTDRQPPAAEEEPPNSHRTRAKKRAAGKRSPAAEKVLEKTGKILSFDKETGNGQERK